MRRRTRFRAPGRALLGLVLLTPPLTGCTSLLEDLGIEEPAAAPPEHAAGTSPNLPALVALQGAVEDRDDELAARLVAVLRRRPLSANEIHLVDSFERILAGRALVDRIELVLVPVPVDGGTELRLELSSPDGPLTLELPPARLEHLKVAVDENGLETRERSSTRWDGLDGVVVPAGAPLVLEVGTLDHSLGRALALREHWGLRLVSGQVLHASGSYPAAHWNEPRCERVTLSPLLPAEPVEPRLFLERCAGLLAGAPDPGPTPLRLALRIAPERRGEVLRALAPLLAGAAAALPGPHPSDGPERTLLPALRWLARTNEPGVELAAWSRWLAAWVAREDERERRKRPSAGLDLGDGTLRWRDGSPVRSAGAEPNSPRGLDLPGGSGRER